MPQSRDFVVYTCVTGGYDELPDVSDEASDVRFVCFGDARTLGPAPGWEIRASKAPPRLTSGHDVNRYHKLFPHHVLPEVRFSIYLDGNIRYDAPKPPLVEYIQREGAALGAFRHPEGRRLEEEPAACRRLGKFDDHDLSRIDAQLQHYAGEGLDLTQLIPTNYLLVRDHAHPDLPLTSSLWWSQLFEFAKRDQVSLSYALFKTGLPWVYLDEDPAICSDDIERPKHYRPRGLIQKLRHRMRHGRRR